MRESTLQTKRVIEEADSLCEAVSHEIEFEGDEKVSFWTYPVSLCKSRRLYGKIIYIIEKILVEGKKVRKKMKNFSSWLEKKLFPFLNHFSPSRWRVYEYISSFKIA